MMLQPRFKLKLALMSSILMSLFSTHQAHSYPAYHDNDMAQPYNDTTSWQANITLGKTSQNYQETSTNTEIPNGILNQETGQLNHLQLSLSAPRYDISKTKKAGGKHTSLSAQAIIDLAQGSTDYQGYLQQLDTFTPYHSTTDNNQHQYQLDLQLNQPITPTLTIIPTVSIQHHRWQRGLTQYQENFRHTAALAGIGMTYQTNQRIANRPIVIHASSQYGKILNSHIGVDKFDFSQNIGKAKIEQQRLQADYPITPKLSTNIAIQHQRWRYKQSDEQLNLSYPDSQSKQTTWQVGMGYKF